MNNSQEEKYCRRFDEIDAEAKRIQAISEQSKDPMILKENARQISKLAKEHTALVKKIKKEMGRQIGNH